jgi:preprotein translocase subunit SecD
MKSLRTLIFILVIVAIAIFLSWPTDPGINIPFLGIQREVKTRLGLDLVGGIQVLMEADLPAGQAIDSEAMDTAMRIVSDQVAA